MNRLLAIALGVLSLAAMAGMDVDPYDTTVSPGVWCGNFTSAKDYAVQHNIPLVLVWGNYVTGEGPCEYCEQLCMALKTTTAQLWAQGKQAVFCFVEGTGSYDTPPNNGAKEFARARGTLTSESPSQYPFVKLWFPDVASVAFTGRSGLMYSTSGSGLFEQFKSSYDKFIVESEKLMTHSYVTFPFRNTANDRLEAVPGKTVAIEFPLVRTNALDLTTACEVAFSCGSSSVVSNVVWATGVDEIFVRYVLPGAFAASTPVTVTLRETTGTVLATRQVTAVEEGENSPKNPRFVGERTADGLVWGEWTMDMDVATQKVAGVKGSATLVLVGGSLWCPDCYSTDAYLIDTPEFKTWARDHQIACVAIDVTNPNSKTANTSLLTWESTKVSDRYITCNKGKPADESLRYESGAGYLTRHGVTGEEAAAVAARNKWLLNNSTLVGGLCRPEDMEKDNDRTGPFKTGIPCLIAVRPDGTIAGRIYQFNNTSASNTVALAGHIARLTELFEQGEDAREEDNDASLTTGSVLVPGMPGAGTVSAVDSRDFWRIDADAYDNVEMTLSGVADAEMTVRVTDESGEYEQTLAEATGTLAKGIQLKFKTESDRTFVRIGFPQDSDGYATAAYFGFTNTVSTRAEYVLNATAVPSGGVVGFVRTQQIVTESCGETGSKQVLIEVSRQQGSEGSASVRVTCTDDLTKYSDRVAWKDAVISWADGESGVKTIPLTVFDDEEPNVTLSLNFALSEFAAEAADAVLDDSAKALEFLLYDDDVFGELVYRNVAYSNVFELADWQPGDSVTISKSYGSLPSGLTVKSIGGKVMVTGKPTRAGEYDVLYRVTLWRDGAVVDSTDISFACTVRDVAFGAVIPSLARTSTYRNLPVVRENVLVGLLTVSVPASGRVSAKYRSKDLTATYSCTGWSEFDEVGAEIRAVLSRTGRTSERMELVLRELGGTIVFPDPKTGATIEVELPETTWSSAQTAAAWTGQYTVQLPQTNLTDKTAEFEGRLCGSAYMAMRILTPYALENGNMLYAGVLPNGQAFSGTATLLASGGSAKMPVLFNRDMLDVPCEFSGVFDVAANAAITYKQPLGRWSVTADSLISWSVDDAHGHAGEFAVYGGYYDKTEISTVFERDFKTDPEKFAFLASTEMLISGRYGNGEELSPVDLEMVNNEPRLRSSAQNPQNLILRFSPETGVVSGSFRMPFEDEVESAVTFRGIALPGWQGCNGCGDTPVELPWAVGAFSFSDRDGQENVFRNGGSIELGRRE